MEAAETCSCKLTNADLRKRKTDVIVSLKQHVIERVELADGVNYKFHYTDQMFDEVTSFIKTERLCDDFFEFKIAVTQNHFIRLSISGAGPAKEFILTELDM